MLTPLLTGNQVAQILGISRSFAYQLLRHGRIPSVRIGRSIRCRPSDLEQFVMENIVAEKVFPLDDKIRDLVETQSLLSQK